MILVPMSAFADPQAAQKTATAVKVARKFEKHEEARSHQAQEARHRYGPPSTKKSVERDMRTKPGCTSCHGKKGGK